MDFGTMQKKAAAHKIAARRWDKAARAYADALRAAHEAEEAERKINTLTSIGGVRINRAVDDNGDRW